jgi:integrase
MRNPNGYGTVAKLSGNRRKPFVVRKTTGWDDRGYPIYLIIGYYPTREAGMIALAAYNQSPYDVDGAKITLDELFNKWIETAGQKIGGSNLRSLKSAYNHCNYLGKTKYKEIRAFHMQETIDNCGRGYSTQGAIKNLWRHLDNYAMSLDVITRKFSDLLTSDSVPETSKMPFTDEEVNRLWNIVNESFVDSVLVFLYSGWRISELLGMKCEDVDIDAGVMKGGTKTKAGKGRIVPIHSKIFPLVKARYDEGNEFLFSINGQKISPQQYYIIWNRIMSTIECKHTVHECRHTFRTRLDNAGANKRCMDLLMGHTSKDVGERVYNHKSIQDLRNAIELITD